MADAEGIWCQFLDALQSSGIPGQVVGGSPMVGSHATLGALQNPMDATLVKEAKACCIIADTLVLKVANPVVSLSSPGNIHCPLSQVLAYLLDFKLDPYTAAEAPQTLPMSETETITVEDRLTHGAVEDLVSLASEWGRWPTTTISQRHVDCHRGSPPLHRRQRHQGLKR